jgi:ABC-type sulfate transport system substrate-binding protein
MIDLVSRYLNKWNIYRFVKFTLIAFVIILIAYNGWQVEANTSPERIIVYAFSTQEEVLSQGIIPSFEKMWKDKTGQEIKIEAVFGPSATLAGQIILSAPADVALFSNAHHVKWLKLWRLVRQDNEPSVIGYTPMVIVTRPDNPNGITEFNDLGSPGLRLVHGDPRSAGAGEWGLLAEYGSALLESNDPDLAASQLKKTWQNVNLVGPSARSSLTMFELGAGDALITYEQDARLALERGVQLEIVIPTTTIVCHHLAVKIDKNVSRREQPIVKAFIDYLLSPAGQELFRRYHLRPINLEHEGFPSLRNPFTVEDMGGWSQAYSEVIEAILRSEIEPHLDLDLSSEFMESGG